MPKAGLLPTSKSHICLSAGYEQVNYYERQAGPEVWKNDHQTPLLRMVVPKRGRLSLVCPVEKWESNHSETTPSVHINNTDYFVFSSIVTEKAMASHSSTLAWKIPWTEEPGRLQSMGLLRVGHDWATSLSLFTFMHWRRKWQSTPVFLPGESQGWGSLVGCYLWGRTESDTTEVT